MALIAHPTAYLTETLYRFCTPDGYAHYQQNKREYDWILSHWVENDDEVINLKTFRAVLVYMDKVGKSPASVEALSQWALRNPSNDPQFKKSDIIEGDLLELKDYETLDLDDDVLFDSLFNRAKSEWHQDTYTTAGRMAREKGPIASSDWLQSQLAAFSREMSDEEPEQEESGSRSIASSVNADFTSELIIRSASDYVTEELRWVWPEKIPQGKVVLFTGLPDGGKTMCALDVIARVTTGRDWPDGSKNTIPPSRVMLASTEDDPKDTLVPRLIAAGADISKVEIVVGMVITAKDSKRRKSSLNLKRDARMLLEAIKTHPDIQLLVLDPISSFFGDDADQNKDKDIRPIMDSLKATCEKSGLTVIGIIHSNKRSDVGAVHKVSGAGSLAASVRAVWGFSRDSDDKNKCHMAHVKGNLTKDKSGLDYIIEETPVTLSSGKSVGAAHTVWGAKCEADADELLAASREKKDGGDYKVTIAKAYLRSVKYPIKAKTLYEQAENAERLSADVIKRAKIKLWAEDFHLVSRKHHDGWHWYHEVEGKILNDPSPVIEEVE